MSADNRNFAIKKEQSPMKDGSFTPPISGDNNDQGWQEIPLKGYTEDDIKDKRYHIARFNSKQNIDILKDFNKPVRLHRKDPRNLQFHLSRKEMDIRKREQQARKAAQEEKRRQRAAGIKVDADEDEDEDMEGDGDNKDNIGSEDTDGNGKINNNEMDLSQVAPEGGARKLKKHLFRRKTRQINVMNDEKKKLRYEEYYPWVMEDYDGKNVFVGNYEAGASESTNVLFVFDKDGFKMIPAEKVYKFNPRNKYATLTLEEAEAKMEKKSSVPRWLMRHMEDQSVQGGNDKDYRFRNITGNSDDNRRVMIPNNNNRSNNQNRRMRTVTGETQLEEGGDSDQDDLDFDEEFDDDEEAPIMDGDEEENKLSEQKIKKEMLKAAHFDGQSDAESDDDLDDLFETEKSRKIDKEGKKLRKVLNKNEGGVYDSEDDDQDNPYLSRSDLESDEDSSPENNIKKEEQDGLDGDASTSPRQFFAHNVGEGFVVVKAPSSFLSGFQAGDWLPNGRKRTIPTQPSEGTPQKKSKVNDADSPKVKKEKSNSPSPPLSNADLTDAGPDGSLVTVNEVLDILRNNPLTTKDLLIRLRNRVNAHKDNKQRTISIVKRNLKLVDGKLVLKE